MKHTQVKSDCGFNYNISFARLSHTQNEIRQPVHLQHKFTIDLTGLRQNRSKIYRMFSILAFQNSNGNLQQLCYTNLPTVISHKYFNRSPSCKFSIILVHIHFLTWSSNQAHANLGKLGKKGSSYY